MFRISPNLPAGAYKTYQISAPLSTHYRAATCDEAACPHQANGWATAVDEALDLGQRQAHYIRKVSGRRFTERRDESGLTVFEFAAGQQCFAEHKVRLDRAERYIVRGGDHRGDPTGGRPFQHTRPADWVEDFAEHQQGVADRLERG